MLIGVAVGLALSLMVLRLAFPGSHRVTIGALEMTFPVRVIHRPGRSIDTMVGTIKAVNGDFEKMQSYFAGKKVTVTLRDGLLRLSPHFYNTEKEIDRFFVHLDEYCKQESQSYT